MSKGKLYFGGMPVEPDIKLLFSRWPTLNPGDRIEYEDVALIIGVSWKENRFRTVTEAWRKRVQSELGVEIRCEPGIAFYVITAGESIDLTSSDLGSARRKLGRRRRVLSEITIEDSPTAERRDSAAKLLLMVEHEISRNERQLKIKHKPIKPLPFNGK